MSDVEQRASALEAASIESSHQGMKALLLLNGGACIAILGLLANIITDDLAWPAKQFMTAATRSLVYFASGAGVAVFTTLMAYLCNQAYATAIREKKIDLWKWAQWWNRITVFVAFSSLILFAMGVYEIWKSQQ